MVEEMKWFVVKYGCGHKAKAPGVNAAHASEFAENELCEKCADAKLAIADKKHDEAMVVFWAKRKREHEAKEKAEKAQAAKKKVKTVKKKKGKSARVRVSK